MNSLELYILSLFVVKSLFALLSLYRLFIKAKYPDDKNRLKKIDFWRSRMEFIFISMMSVLLIYVFYPWANRLEKINSEMKMLLFFLGFILLLTENWMDFFTDSPLFVYIQSRREKRRS